MQLKLCGYGICVSPVKSLFEYDSNPMWNPLDIPRLRLWSSVCLPIAFYFRPRGFLYCRPKMKAKRKRKHTQNYPSRSKSKRKTLFRGLRQPRVTIETGSHIEEASTAPFTIIYWPPVLCHKGAHTDIVCEDLLTSHQHNTDTIAQSVHPKW